MTSIFDLPSETLATVFEIGVHAWGVEYLHHVSLVCKDWHLITNLHPHLWGILDIEKTVVPIRAEQLYKQLLRAKEAPLDVTCHASSNALRYEVITNSLARLRRNFVRSSLILPPTDITEFADVHLWQEAQPIFNIEVRIKFEF